MKSRILTVLLLASLVLFGAGCPTPPVPPTSTPVITPSSGTYNNSVEVSMKCSTDLSKIYYTTNGAVPSKQSTEYSNPFVLSNSASVKAIGIAPILSNSAVAVVDYTIVITTNPPVPPPSTNGWRYATFIKANPYENYNGAASAMGYRGIHGKPNENPWRVEMVKGTAALGCDTLVYIRGNSDVNNPVLDMCLNGRKHPGDGHYFPIKDPLTAGTEVDWAMWAAKDYGIAHQLCWIWNDDKSMPLTEDVVKQTIAGYDGTRLPIENVALGVCLEANEIMSSDQAAQALTWIRNNAPKARAIVGSSSDAFLIAVANKAPAGCYYWLEASTDGDKNPITDPLTLANVDAKILNKARNIGNKVGKQYVICGEWWAADDNTRKQVTAKIISEGFSSCGQFK